MLKYLFRRKSKIIKTQLAEYYKSLTLIVDLDLLIDNIISKIKEISGSENVCIYILNPNSQRYECKNDNNFSKYEFFTSDKLIFWFSVNKRALSVKKDIKILDFFNKRELENIKSLNASLIYPLIVMNNIKGLIFISDKKNKRSFSSLESETLTSYIRIAAFALENAILHKEKKDDTLKIMQSDRLSILGQLASGAAHEIRNPLTSIRSTIQYLRNHLPTEDKQSMADNVIQEVDRINEIIQGMLSFSKPDKLNLSEYNLKQLIEDCVRLISKTAENNNVDIEINYSSLNKKIFADGKQLKQVFLNMILNAVSAIKDSGKITIDINDRVSENENSKFYLIEIQDTGKGINEEDVMKIFDPFYTTKENGTGLGLSISYRIINQHNGDITVNSKVGKGTTFYIKLPQNKNI